MSKYIDAEKLKQILRPEEWGTPDERWVPEHEIGAMLDYFPAADVQEVRHGHWVYDKGDCFPKCSVCGQYHGTLYEHYYCPVCGALMDGDVEYA